jgi:tetratricopeptide (TPR) repeat protein
MVGRGLENLGRIDEAFESHRHQLAAVTDPATAPSPAVADASALFARASMGRLYNNNGDWDAAIEVLRPAVALVDTVAIPRMQAIALAGLGEALCETGAHGEGVEHLRAALVLYGLNNESETARVQALLRKYTVA